MTKRTRREKRRPSFKVKVTLAAGRARRRWWTILSERKTVIGRSHALPVTRQARELGISRGSVYCLPRPTAAVDLATKQRIDALHMDFPFASSRMLRDLLAAEGIEVGWLHVSTLMKKMAIEAIHRRPNTLKPAPGHMIYPYLPRSLR